MADYKDRVRKAMENHHKKNLRKNGNVSRKNGKPEQAVVKELLKWAEHRGLHLHVVESKAVYSKAAGRYLRSQTSESLPDLLGNYQELSVWIEAKAKGRVSTLKEHQRSFLYHKAIQGCFSCVVDSVEMLSNHFETFLTLNKEERIKYLTSHLEPKKSHIYTDKLF